MTDLDKLLRQYIERFESGGDVDPSDLIAQAETGEQAELRELIAGYLEHAAPGRDWDAAAFEGSVAERAVARTAEEWSAAAGELPVELVRLRNEREITREDLVTRLADSLGVSGAREKVASYYHRLERGLLPAEGVSARVWEALAELLGHQRATPSVRAAAVIHRPPTEEAASAYARTCAPTAIASTRRPQDHLEEALESHRTRTAQKEPDEVDRLVHRRLVSRRSWRRSSNERRPCSPASRNGSGTASAAGPRRRHRRHPASGS